MNKENLIIIAGMPRAGTTYMYETLQTHPDLFLPIVKETNYFSYNCEAKGEGWFENLYKKATIEQKMFDVSPLYFLDVDRFIKNVHEFNKNQKVILILRDPNEWLKSCYKQFQKQNFKKCDFEKYVKDFKVYIENQKQNYDLMNLDYLGIVEKFINEFKGNLLLIDFEIFQKDKTDVLAEIEKFIGVRKYFTTDNVNTEKINASCVENSKIIAYLARFTLLRTIAFRTMPASFLHYIRNKYIYGVPVPIEEEQNLPDLYDRGNVYKEKYFKNSSIVRC